MGFWDNGMLVTVLSFPIPSLEKVIDPGKHASGRPWRMHQRPQVLLGSLRKGMGFPLQGTWSER